MPSYMLRQIPAALWQRVRAEATRGDLPLRAVVLALLEDALRVREGRRAGQRALAERMATMTPTERTAQARRGGLARAKSAGWNVTEEDQS